MADSVYNRAKGDIDSTDLRVMLIKSTGSFNPDHDFVSDIVANECDFTNYARKAVTGESEVINDTADRFELDADDPTTYTSAGNGVNNTLGALVVYEEGGGTDATRNLISWHDTNINGVITDGNDLTIQFNAAGILHKT